MITHAAVAEPEAVKLRPAFLRYFAFGCIAAVVLALWGQEIAQRRVSSDDLTVPIVVLVALSLIIACIYGYCVTLEPSRVLYRRPLLGTVAIELNNIQTMYYVHSANRVTGPRLAVKYRSAGRERETIINTRLFSRKSHRALLAKLQSTGLALSESQTRYP